MSQASQASESGAREAIDLAAIEARAREFQKAQVACPDDCVVYSPNDRKAVADLLDAAKHTTLPADILALTAAAALAGEELEREKQLRRDQVSSMLATEKNLEAERDEARREAASHLAAFCRKSECVDRLTTEVSQLRGAIRRAGFEVMQTSGDWSIHDVSKLGEEEWQKTLEILNKNTDLETENAALTARLSAAEAERDTAIKFRMAVAAAVGFSRPDVGPRSTNDAVMVLAIKNNRDACWKRGEEIGELQEQLAAAEASLSAIVAVLDVAGVERERRPECTHCNSTGRYQIHDQSNLMTVACEHCQPVQLSPAERVQAMVAEHEADLEEACRGAATMKHLAETLQGELTALRTRNETLADNHEQVCSALGLHPDTTQEQVIEAIGKYRHEARDYPNLAARIEAGNKFKEFVHRYLDQHGVPHGDPNNEHQKKGCRIGARLDLMFARTETLEGLLREAATHLSGIQSRDCRDRIAAHLAAAEVKHV